MPTIIADEHIPFLKGVLEPYARVIYLPADEITRDIVREAEGLIVRTRTHCDKELLEGSNIQFVATATIGIDHIDTTWCEENDIHWYHAPGCNSTAVYQYLAAALVTLRSKYGFHFLDKTMGIIGVGNVGSKVAHLARSLGMKTLLNDPPRARVEGIEAFTDLDTLLEEADIISIHVPLIRSGEDKTFHLADNTFFEKLQKKPIIINTSRGEVVETEAIKKALTEGQIETAVLDVWEHESRPDRQLLDLTSIATPHIAGYSVEGKANGTAVCVRNAGKFFGFGLQDWYPDHLPEPLNPILHPEVKNLDDDIILSAMIGSAYNIRKDDHLLRSHPENFEYYRSHYHYRREFSAYRVDPGIFSPDLAIRIKELGFNFLRNNGI